MASSTADRRSASAYLWPGVKLTIALRTIYGAPSAEAAGAAPDAFERGAWAQKFPTAVASWRRAWTHPFFAFPPEVRLRGSGFLVLAALTDLGGGLTVPDDTGRSIVYRFLKPSDDFDVLTELLHESYSPLAAAGMRFVASHQDSSVTRERCGRGETILALDAGQIVGTITLTSAEQSKGPAFYNRPDVAAFGQFAVRPSHQRCGIGSTLLALVEARAKEQGVAMLGLDTSEHATELLDLYQRRGYYFVEDAQWQKTNYRSVVLGKRLIAEP